MNVALDALAVFRLWRLASKDAITADARGKFNKAIWRRARRHTVPTPGEPEPVPKLITLVECPWCLGFWLCLGAALWSRAHPRTWTAARNVLATSAVVGLIAETETRIGGH